MISSNLYWHVKCFISECKYILCLVNNVIQIEGFSNTLWNYLYLHWFCINRLKLLKGQIQRNILVFANIMWQIFSLFLWIFQREKQLLDFFFWLQMEALNKMKAINNLVKISSLKVAKNKLKDVMHTCLKQPVYKEALSNIKSPLDPSVILSELK